MDDPDCDLAKLYRTYAQFKVVNRVVAGWQQTYRTYVRPLLHQDKTNTLLDIGAGGADVTRAIAHWARRDGLVLHITAADPDDRAYTWAMHHQPDDGQIGRASCRERAQSSGGAGSRKSDARGVTIERA